jgi:hypothetical protein
MIAAPIPNPIFRNITQPVLALTLRTNAVPVSGGGGTIIYIPPLLKHRGKSADLYPE